MLMNIITGPIGRLLLMIVFMTMFSLWLGGINQWYLQTVDACEVGGERLDRVVIPASTATTEVEDAWQAITGTRATDYAVTRAADLSTAIPVLAAGSAHTVEADGDGCRLESQIALTGATDVTTNWGAASYDAYTPTGLEIALNVPAIPAAALTANTDAAVDWDISGGEWSEESSALEAGGLGPVIPTLFQAAILAPPVLLLTVLGSVASDFVKRAGGSPIIAMVIMGVIVLLFATILNTMIPFLTDAYEAIDGNRFRAMDEGIGSLSTVIGNFFGVSLVAGALSVAWTLFNSVRTGGNAITQAGNRGGGRRGGVL